MATPTILTSATQAHSKTVFVEDVCRTVYKKGSIPFGSVAGKVIETSPAPVWTTRPVDVNE